MPMPKLRILERKANSNSSPPMSIWTSEACTLSAHKQIAWDFNISERSLVFISGVKENLCPLLVIFHPGFLPHPSPRPRSRFPPAGFPWQPTVTLTRTLSYQATTLFRPWERVAIHAASGRMCITWARATEQVNRNSNSWDSKKHALCSVTLFLRFSWEFICGVTWMSWDWRVLTQWNEELPEDTGGEQMRREG